MCSIGQGEEDIQGGGASCRFQRRLAAYRKQIFLLRVNVSDNAFLVLEAVNLATGEGRGELTSEP